MKMGILIPILACCALALMGCHRPAETGEASDAKVSGESIEFSNGSAQLASLATMAPEPTKSAIVHLNGRLIWDEEVTVRVFAPFGGRVSKIVTQLGQVVQPGESLALIASAEYGQAQADAHRAEVDFQLAERTWRRLKELAEHGATSFKDLSAAEADYSRARSEKERAALRLGLYGGATNAVDHICPLKSPLAGTVVEKNINPGQEVRSDIGSAPPLFVITDPTRLWIQIDATEQDLKRLKPGQTVSVSTRTYPGQTFTGRIEVVSDFLDPTSRTIKVRGSIENSKRLLKAEMFVSADLEAEEPDALQVPAKAVFLRGERHCLFVEQAPGKYERREVQIGAERDGKIVVVSGLKAEQRVVTDGTLLLEQLMSEGGS